MEKNDHREKARRRYWRTNIVVMTILLVGWACVGLGGGILFADFLNRGELPGTGVPIGFWMAHQGSIIGFVAIILVYCIVMNFLDRRYFRDLQSVDDQ